MKLVQDQLRGKTGRLSWKQVNDITWRRIRDQISNQVSNRIGIQISVMIEVNIWDQIYE